LAALELKMRRVAPRPALQELRLTASSPPAMGLQRPLQALKRLCSGSALQPAERTWKLALPLSLAGMGTGGVKATGFRARKEEEEALRPRDLQLPPASRGGSTARGCPLQPSPGEKRLTPKVLLLVLPRAATETLRPSSAPAAQGEVTRASLEKLLLFPALAPQSLSLRWLSRRKTEPGAGRLQLAESRLR